MSTSSDIGAISTESNKRKRGDSPPSERQDSAPKTLGLVLLLQRDNLAMATDFAAFKKEFDSQGISAEYKSLFDLDDLIEKQGELIYGRDDILGRSREVVLKKGCEKFYSIEADPKKMKDGIMLWLRTMIPAAKKNDNILLVLISHGTGRGSVVIGGAEPTDDVEYLTNLEVKSAVINLRRHTYFTLVNTCCYSGGWVNIAQTGLGNRFFHAATTKMAIADNFIISSGKYRGGVFVTALLECLKRNGEGQLLEFSAEIKAEVMAYRSPVSPDHIPAPPQSAVSNSSFWKRPVQAFIPIQNKSNLAETLSAAVMDLKSVTLSELFKLTRPAKRREIIPDEIVREVRDAQELAARRGGANGEDQIYHACREILDGEANQFDQEAVFRTVSWRERSMLQAARIERYLEETGMINSDASTDIEEENLTKKGGVYYDRIFSGSKIIERSKLPPKGCIGGPYEVPYTWLANLVGASQDNVSVTRLKNSFEECLAAAVIAESKQKRDS